MSLQEKLGEPKKGEAEAVDARQELDLKVGVAFTRFQTRYFQVGHQTATLYLPAMSLLILPRGTQKCYSERRLAHPKVSDSLVELHISGCHDRQGEVASAC